MRDRIEDMRFGWVRDYPDFRDYTLKSEAIRNFLLEESSDVASEACISNAIALPPIKDQLSIGSCTANAASYMYETYLRVAGISSEPLSRLFIYKITRNLLGWTGDTGAHLRSTMQTLATFGSPPEKFYTYHTDKFEEEPTAFLYSMAQNYQAETYYRLDNHGTTAQSLLKKIKKNIAANRACVFGFVVYSNIDIAEAGCIAMPAQTDKRRGGHAVCCVGFEDEKIIVNAQTNTSTRGAIKFANSWGTQWGSNGFGWLPYDYILNGLAVDWWTIMSAEWLDTNQFS